MRANKIDQLFKEKLERHQESVSADAFAKVQGQLKSSKKHKKPIYWMVAASVGILAMLTTTIFFNLNKQEVTVVAQIDSIKGSNLFAEQEIKQPAVQTEQNEGESLTKTVKQSPLNTKTMYVKSNSAPLNSIAYQKPEKTTSNLEKLSAIAPMENALAVDLAKIPFSKSLRNTESTENIKVEIHYNTLANHEIKSDSKSEIENFMSKNNSKLKALASEYNLAELRNAKNDLFASALQFNKKASN